MQISRFKIYFKSGKYFHINATDFQVIGRDESGVVVFSRQLEEETETNLFPRSEAVFALPVSLLERIEKIEGSEIVQTQNS